MSALVSVITAAYNCEKTIRETIDSVLNQTFTNWEMLIVDDCSTDNTISIVEEYVEKDNRIKLIHLEKNSGSATARNVAINRSSGRYIALLDSDDLWKPEKLELQLKFMKSNNYCFTFTAYDVFKDSKDVRRKIFAVPQRINYKQFLKNSVIGCLTVVVDKERIQDFHMESGYLEDTLTWMHYLQKGIIAYGLNKNLASYRITKGSKSSNKIENAGRYYQCLKKQKGIGTISRIYYFMCYAYHAVKKRLFSKITTEI
ncbi:MAG: glycosyltransferase family 2 protein [Ruminococcus sp.]|nr:glycosyltransferase family 2 protein [Ruminococcus sp.]